MTDNSKYFLTEAEIPENWEPAEPAPGVAAPPRPNPMPQFFSGSMPPGLQHDSTFVGTEVGSPRIPKHSLMPFGIQGRPSTNAGIHSTASKTLPAGGGTSGKIELVIPGSTLTPSDQTVDLPGPLAFDWVASPYGEVLATPPITGVGAYIDGAFSAKSLAASATFGMSLTPSQNSEVIFSIGNDGASATISGGWFPAPGTGSIADYQISSSEMPVAVGYTTGGTPPNWVGGMFGAGLPPGTTPTFVQAAHGNIGYPYTGTTITFGSSITAGNAILLFISGGNSYVPNPGPTASVSDSQLNIYTELVAEYNDAVGSSFPGQVYVFVFAATQVVSGATSITVHWTSTPAAGSGAAVFAVEVSGLSKLIGKPTFRKLVSSDLPTVNQTVESNGTAEPQESTLDFSTDFTVADNPVTKSTNIALAVAPLPPSLKVNSVGVSTDKKLYVNGVSDGAAVSGVNIDGVPDGG